jgi:hypothetical protein
MAIVLPPADRTIRLPGVPGHPDLAVPCYSGPLGLPHFLYPEASLGAGSHARVLGVIHGDRRLAAKIQDYGPPADEAEAWAPGEHEMWGSVVTDYLAGGRARASGGGSPLPVLLYYLAEGPAGAEGGRKRGRLLKGSLIMLMERLEPIPLPAGPECLGSLARDLGAVGAAGLVHGDVKLSNAAWDPVTRRARLIDYGLATNAGEGAGHLYYSAWHRPPELLEGTPAPGPEADAWAFGMLVLDLATGHPGAPVWRDGEARAIFAPERPDPREAMWAYARLFGPGWRAGAPAPQPGRLEAILAHFGAGAYAPAIRAACRACPAQRARPAELAELLEQAGREAK